jgi:hypothetical protein
MATLLKVLNNLADIKSAGGVALRLRTQEVVVRALLATLSVVCAMNRAPSAALHVVAETILLENRTSNPIAATLPWPAPRQVAPLSGATMAINQ